MRKIYAFSFIGLFSLLGSAQAAEPASNDLAAVPFLRYGCYFEGRGHNDGNHQGDEVKCRVRGLLRAIESNSSPVLTEFPTFELECTNHFKMDSRYPVIGWGDGRTWINAADDGHIATIAWRQNPTGATIDRENARLVIANRIAIPLDGKCWLENGTPPASE